MVKIIQQKTIPKTLDPVWNEKFTFKRVTSGSKLILNVYDSDFLINDSLGIAEYTFTDDEKCDRERDVELDVMDNNKNFGKILVTLFVRRVQFNVDLVFVSGKGLPAGDNKTSDPYLIAHLLSVKYTTNYVSNTLNPEWNEKWFVNNVKAGEKLLIEVYDKDLFTKDDFLGRGEYIFQDDEVHDSKKKIDVDIVVDEVKKLKEGTVQIELHFICI